LKRLLASALFLVSLASVAQPKVTSREIIDKMNKGESVEYQGAEIVGDLDLTQLKNQRLESRKNTSQKFHANLVEVPFHFTNCTFTGDIITTRQPEQPNIYYTNFTQDVKLLNCTFKGVMAFRHATFSDRVTCEGSQFKARTDFVHTIFLARPIFRAVTFPQATNFRHTEFKQGVDFTKAMFRGEIDFRHTIFPEGVSFKEATFEREADFTHAEFSARVDWTGVSFRRGFGSEHAQFNGRRYDLASDVKANR
jgi:uncharacterized protein YjbI with pentapeptide repeats